MNVFKMNAELSCDIENFIALVKKEKLNFSGFEISGELGMENNMLVLNTTHTIEETMKAIDRVDDAHRMIQTIQPFATFSQDAEWNDFD